MGDRGHSRSPNYDPGSSPPAAPHSSAARASPDPARSPSDRRGYSRSVSRSRSPSRSRSRSTSRRKRTSRSRSPGRRQSPRRYTRPVCGNYGVAGGNPNPRMPVVDVLTRFPMTCLFWKTNSCVKGAEKCSYIHGFVCRNDLHCNRKGCSDVHIKATRLSFQSGSRGYMKPGRGGYMRGGGRGGRGYGSYHGFGRDGARDGRRGNFRDAGYGAGGGRQYHGGGRDGSRGRGGSYERRSSRDREAYRRDSADRRPPGEGDRGRWSKERPLSRTRTASSSSSDRSRSRGRRTLSRSPKGRSTSKSSDRSSSSSEASRSRSKSRRRSPSSEKKKGSHEARSNGVTTLKKARKTAAAAAVDPQKVASMFKDDMDLSQETIEKLLEAVGGASKAKGSRRSPSPQQRDKEPAFNDSIGSPYEEEGKSSDGSGTSPPMRPPPPPPPKVTASDLDSVIPPPYRALKAGGGKDMWTPMMERATYDSRPVEPGLSRWEIETPYLTRSEKDSEAAASRPGASPPPRAAARPPPTAKGISSELETLFSRTFDNRYKEPVLKIDKEEKSSEIKHSVDTLDVSEEEDRDSKFAPTQGTGEALSWLMRKRQAGGEGEVAKVQEVTGSSRKRVRSESSESSSEASEDDKPDPEISVQEEKTSGLSSTKASLIQRKTSILKNMKMLMEQKTRLDAQKEELSRNHRGSDDVLQGILNENTVLNEEITKQIQNMCALVDEINKSLEDLDEVQGKSKSKKNKKKKARKKHKKEKRHRQSYPSDDENKTSKHEKSSKSSKLEKEVLDTEESNGHQSMQASGSPVVAPRYWDIVKPLSVADTEAVKRSPSSLYEPREEYKKDYHRDWKEHEGREYEEYGADKRRFVEKRERSHDHNRRGEYHGRGAAADDHEAGKYGRDYELDRRAPFQTRLHDGRHNKPEEGVKAEGRFLRRSSSPGADRRESRKFGGGMYADKLESVPTVLLPAGVGSSAEKGKADTRQIKVLQKQDEDKPAVSKEELLKRITTMQFKHPERVRKRHSSSEDKKPVDVVVENEVEAPTREIKHEGSSDFIDQGMHWCGLCNMFYDTLPQYLEHLLQDAHLLKLKDDAKSWLTASPPEEKDLAALTRPLQAAA